MLFLEDTIDWIFIESYNRQRFTDIKMKNYNIKTTFDRPKGPAARANKIGINSIILLFNVHGILSVIRCYIRFFQYGREPVQMQRIFIGFEASKSTSKQ